MLNGIEIEFRVKIWPGVLSEDKELIKNEEGKLVLEQEKIDLDAVAQQSTAINRIVTGWVFCHLVLKFPVEKLENETTVNDEHVLCEQIAVLGIELLGFAGELTHFVLAPFQHLGFLLLAGFGHPAEEVVDVGHLDVLHTLFEVVVVAVKRADADEPGRVGALLQLPELLRHLLDDGCGLGFCLIIAVDYFLDRDDVALRVGLGVVPLEGSHSGSGVITSRRHLQSEIKDF